MSETISAEYPFDPKTKTIHGSKMSYMDTGAGDRTVVFLHGNPTSSYLWRNIIPHVSGKARCIAPDLIGMGRSEQPDIEYRFVDHARYLYALLDELDLGNVTLVVHDWGSALGFHWARLNEDRVDGIAFMEAIVAPVPGYQALGKAEELFRNFRTKGVGENLILEQNMFVEQVLPNAVVRDLTEEEMAFYRAPYPTPKSRTPTWRWPNEIPIGGEPADVHEIVSNYAAWLAQTDIPKLMFHAQPGAIMPPMVVELCKQTMKNLETCDLGKGIHFVQEDHPHTIGRRIADWLSG